MDVTGQGTAPAAVKPRLRGVVHEYAFYASLVAGAVLVANAPSARAAGAALVYAISLSALLGTSALYHRPTWSAGMRRWLGRLDHSMIAVLIAGTFTPFAVIGLPARSGDVMLWTVWGGAFALIALHVLWIDAPKPLSAVLYVLLGWVGVAAVPELAGRIGWSPVGLLLLGGLLYSVGAAVYALRRPDPSPAVFGYHEVFHVLVVLAAVAHWSAVALTILPT